jgi:sugar/nucleoside kinase (ribokinase family)
MKKYDVYGIGNAIVDIVTEVEHDFFTRNNVEKGLMTLVDEKRQIELMNVIDMNKSKMTGGGSAANTVVAVSQFGGKSFYSLLVANDDFGKFFLEDLNHHGVESNLKFKDCPPGHTGRCLVMTSPDASRTLNTFLGVSSFLSTEHLDESAIKNSAILYLEGYLVPSPKGLEAMKEAKRVAERNNVQVALTFSDPAMVKYFSKQMEEIVGASVDLLFCNDEEAMIYTGTDSISDAREKLKQVAKRFVITFSGAFLYGITHHHTYAEAGKLASLASSKVVTQFGPRLETQQVKKVLKDLSKH